jgi:hypothetical protein
MRDMTTIVPCAVRLRLAPSFAGYVVVIVTGLFVPTIAVLGYLVIAALHHGLKMTSPYCQCGV